MFVAFGEPVLRLWAPDAGRLATARRLRTTTGGPESVAAAAARAIDESHYCTVLPDSPLGRRVAGELRERNVAVHVTHREGRVALEFAEEPGNGRAQTTVPDRETTATSTIEEGDLPLDTVRSADAVYTTGVAAGGSAALARATARFCKTAADARATVGLGLHHRPDQWDAADAREALTGIFPAVDVLVATPGDVARVLDRDGAGPEVAHSLAATHDLETVALVRDRNAVVVHDSTAHDHAFPMQRPPSDRIDAFAGCFLTSLDAGADEATRRGVAAATLSDPGTLPVLDGGEVHEHAGELD